MSDPLAAARRAQAHVLAAEEAAKTARKKRDAAVVAAYKAGVRAPSIHHATKIGEPLIRKILRAAGAVGSQTEEPLA